MYKKLIKEEKKRERPDRAVLFLVLGLSASLIFINMIMSETLGNEEPQVLLFSVISVLFFFLSQRETFKTAEKKRRVIERYRNIRKKSKYSYR
jgi:membrane protein implicated in regulation of membrane protease activity